MCQYYPPTPKLWSAVNQVYYLTETLLQTFSTIKFISIMILPDISK